MRRKTKTTKEYSFTVLYEPVDTRGYQITVPVLSGLVSYGRTFKEAQYMARDAIKCYLEALKKDREKIPSEKSLLQERITIAV